MVLVEATTVKERLITPHGELELRERSLESDIQWEITQDGFFVCSTNRNQSAAELISYGLDALAIGMKEINLLIAGLGLGASLRTALGSSRVSKVDVVEWEKAIIGWNIRFFGQPSKNALMDPRTRLIAGNLREVLPEIHNRYQLIALDIDNGPEWPVHPENAGIYGREFLALIKDHLVPEGILTVWSGRYQDSFFSLLDSIFSRVDVKQVWDKDSQGNPLEAFIYRAVS